jgi:hypothetical protein
MREPGDGGSDRAWPTPGGVVASPTTRMRSWWPPLRPPTLLPRARAESPARSRVRGPRSSRPAADRAPFCDLGRGLTGRRQLGRRRPQSGTRNSEVGQGEHRQRHMPIPAIAAPYFIVVQSDLALGQFNALLNAPTLPRNPHERAQRRSCRRKYDVVKTEDAGSGHVGTCRRAEQMLRHNVVKCRCVSGSVVCLVVRMVVRMVVNSIGLEDE